MRTRSSTWAGNIGIIIVPVERAISRTMSLHSGGLASGMLTDHVVRYLTLISAHLTHDQRLISGEKD